MSWGGGAGHQQDLRESWPPATPRTFPWVSKPGEFVPRQTFTYFDQGLFSNLLCPWEDGMQEHPTVGWQRRGDRLEEHAFSRDGFLRRAWKGGLWSTVGVSSHGRPMRILGAPVRPRSSAALEVWSVCGVRGERRLPASEGLGPALQHGCLVAEAWPTRLPRLAERVRERLGRQARSASDGHLAIWRLLLLYFCSPRELRPLTDKVLSLSHAAKIDILGGKLRPSRTLDDCDHHTGRGMGPLKLLTSVTQVPPAPAAPQPKRI